MKNFTIESKIFNKKELQNKVNIWRFLGDKIVFTNGCFDILHPGHIAYLEQASKGRRKLIVGLNSDNSVKKLKGDSRPVNPEKDRAFMLAALMSVDAVIVFEEETASEIIEWLKPDIYTKGGDYEAKDLPEYEPVIRNGGLVEILPFVEGYSTTKWIEKLK
ncbi:MAG: D-glycero-beta-D-manno-heptose 1-phosphate adenylyltransferase [Bacteroidia bacterium]|nr:D-glycero-beta-D-manno-heptose 1-phosphate adenylyltransferase [Bacteroidia bacterium]